MATVNEKMTALADEVREISGSEELMGLDDMQQNLDVANENVQTESDLIEQIQVALENKISVDLSDYATIEYVDEAIAAADVGEDIYVQAEEPANAEDGTVWIDLDENIEVKAPDTTLSIAGEPADAKAVGDALANKQPAGDYALKSDIPTDYLTEVPAEYITEAELNAKGYLTSFTEADPTVPAWAKTENKPVYTASEVGADAVGTANSAVSSHNSATNAHSDIRAKIGDLTALNTTAKGNLVAAINEAAASGGSGSGEIPYFDLVAMGLPAVPLDGTAVNVEVDCTTLREAMASGLFKVTFSLNWNGYSIPFTSVERAGYLSAEDCYQVSTICHMTQGTDDVLKLGVFTVRPNKIIAQIFTIQQDSDSDEVTVPTPTESDYGKVLTATADGLVWADATGGANLPAAEEVTFG